MKMNELMIYQVFPLRALTDGQPSHGILEMIDWIPHIKKLGMNAVYFSPVFSSSDHGYDTKDYQKIDERLGTNEDFKKMCDAMHEEGIQVILDGVFNHVGREFFAFEDVREKKWDSPYKDWFYINFDGNSCYDDGFWYEGWEGHFELVKLNLDNEQVRNYLLESVGIWIDKLGIDGLRLDVAYKCYKGLYSSFNTHNMHEIGYSLNRQFGPEEWTLYKGLPLYNFVDNHDVERIASQLEDKEHLPLIYAMEFAMPGVPGVYYGSEWGMEGKKEQGSDDSLRPRIHKEDLVENELTNYIAQLAKVRAGSPALKYGDYLQLAIAPDVLVFQRRTNEDRIIFAMNCGDGEFTAHFDAQAGCGIDLITGDSVDFGGGLTIQGKTAMIIRTEEVSLP